MASEDDIKLEEEFQQSRMSAGTFRRLLGYVRPYRRTLALNLVLTVLATASALLGPKFIQIGIDRFLAKGKSAEVAMHGILVVSAIYLGNLLIGWGLSVAQVKSAIRVGQGAMNDLRMAVFEHIQNFPSTTSTRPTRGRIINRVDTDIDSLDRILTWGANQLLASGLTLVGVFILMLRYDWRLCLAVSLVIPPLAIATRIFHVKGMAAYRKMREQSSKLTAAAAESISGVRVVQAFAREEENLTRFKVLGDEYGRRVLVAARIFHTYMPFVGLCPAWAWPSSSATGQPRVAP